MRGVWVEFKFTIHTIDVQEILNELQSNNIVEFDVFIKYVQNVWDYRIKFKNKFISYIEDSRIFEAEYKARKGLSEREFYSNHSEDLEYKWFYIGQTMEIFCTKLGIDYSALTDDEKIRYDCEYETAYKNYLIQDAWYELEKFENDKKFVYGAYVLSKILQGNKQNILKKDFDSLISELVNRNYYVEKELYSITDFEDVEKNNKGQMNVNSINAMVNTNQNRRVDVNELAVIVKGIMENLSTLKKEEAEEIIDFVKIVKVELLKPEPNASSLKNCLTLNVQIFSIANKTPLLVENLEKLQNYIMQFI